MRRYWGANSNTDECTIKTSIYFDGILEKLEKIIQGTWVEDGFQSSMGFFYGMEDCLHQPTDDDGAQQPTRIYSLATMAASIIDLASDMGQQEMLLPVGGAFVQV